MAFELPPEQFNAVEWTRNKLIRSNQTKEAILRAFTSGYEDFWGVSGSDKTEKVDDVDVTTFVGNGSRHTLEEMQACIDLMGATIIQVRTEATEFVQFAVAAYSDEFPERYRAAAFDYTIDQTTGRLVLTGISKVWAKPEVQEE